jgi:hypothetical protein
MPHVRYTLRWVFMYDASVISGYIRKWDTDPLVNFRIFQIENTVTHSQVN